MFFIFFYHVSAGFWNAPGISGAWLPQQVGRLSLRMARQTAGRRAEPQADPGEGGTALCGGLKIMGKHQNLSG